LPLSGTHTLCPWVLQMTFFCGNSQELRQSFSFQIQKPGPARSRSGSKKLDHRCCLTRIGRQTKHFLISTAAGLSTRKYCFASQHAECLFFHLLCLSRGFIEPRLKVCLLYFLSWLAQKYWE